MVLSTTIVMMYECELSHVGRSKTTQKIKQDRKHVKQTDSWRKVHTSAATGFPNGMRTASLCNPVCLSLGLSLDGSHLCQEEAISLWTAGDARHFDHDLHLQ